MGNLRGRGNIIYTLCSESLRTLMVMIVVEHTLCRGETLEVLWPFVLTIEGVI